jgi:hypothetical protein
MTRDQKHNIWIGKALCSLAPSHHQYTLGYRGAIFVFVCLAEKIASAVEQVCSECDEHGLAIVGFEYLYNQAHMERETTEYEDGLIRRLTSYPVQFENVHYYKPDA